MSTLSRKFLGFQQFTGSGTWVKRPGVRAVLVMCIGGGRGTSGNGGSSSFSTCVGTGGGTSQAGTSGTGGDLNLTSGMSLIEPALLTYGPGCNVFGFNGTGVSNLTGQANTGIASGYGTTAVKTSGGAAMKLFLAQDLPDTVAVTVGAGGSGSAPAAQAGQVWIFEVS